ncbi:MAG: methionine sulfoxide reductase heme-binding subunit [Methylobacteriaceae bacterium]|nr:methionine sulfoxide reductase heme-binding subunit [Methylobacteriaceae bacterium]
MTALWRDRTGAFSWLRTAALIAAVLPALWLIERTLTNDLGSRPINEALHFTGTWTIRFLIATLAVTPLRVLGRWPKLIGIRRYLGLTTFAYAALHFSLYIASQSFDLIHVAAEIALRYYLLIGFTALVGLCILAATSTDASIKRLGAQRWTKLHKVIFMLTPLAVLHSFLQSKIDVTDATIIAAFAVLLIALRLLKRYGNAENPLAVAAVALAVAAATALIEAGWFAALTGVDPRLVLEADLDITMARPVWYALAAGLLLTLIAVIRRNARRKVGERRSARMQPA